MNHNRPLVKDYSGGYRMNPFWLRLPGAPFVFNKKWVRSVFSVV